MWYDIAHACSNVELPLNFSGHHLAPVISDNETVIIAVKAVKC